MLYVSIFTCYACVYICACSFATCMWPEFYMQWSLKKKSGKKKDHSMINSCSAITCIPDSKQTRGRKRKKTATEKKLGGKDKICVSA